MGQISTLIWISETRVLFAHFWKIRKWIVDLDSIGDQMGYGKPKQIVQRLAAMAEEKGLSSSGQPLVRFCEKYTKSIFGFDAVFKLSRYSQCGTHNLVNVWLEIDCRFT